LEDACSKPRVEHLSGLLHPIPILAVIKNVKEKNIKYASHLRANNLQQIGPTQPQNSAEAYAVVLRSALEAF